MSHVKETKFVAEMNIDKNHIDNFVLETDTGTKKLKEKFYQNAATERNNYINSRYSDYERYRYLVFDEIEKRVNLMMPIDNTQKIEELGQSLESLLEIVMKINDSLTVSFKLGIDYIFSEIQEGIALPRLNELLDEFMAKFKVLGIELTIDDFSYTIFTKKYMNAYFNQKKNPNKEVDFNDVFKTIYYVCPKFITQLEYNMIYILQKYDQQLKTTMQGLMDNFITGNGKDKQKIEEEYIEKKSEYMWSTIKNPYQLVNSFISNEVKFEDYIEGSSVREKNFSKFESDIDDSNFYEEMHDLYGCLNEVREYYRYEFLLKDLIKRYNDKSSSKSNYDAKLKELAACEKNRIKYNRLYEKSLKKNIFGVVNREKQKTNVLKVNEEMNKYDSLFYEIEELNMNRIIAEKIKETSSLYDLFECTISSYYYLEKAFMEHFKDEENWNIKDEIMRFIRFLFDENNRFLRKSNGFVPCDMPELIADKYKIIGFTINKEDVSPEKIDETLEVIKYIITVKYLEESELSLDKIGFILKYHDIKKEIQKNGVEVI